MPIFSALKKASMSRPVAHQEGLRIGHSRAKTRCLLKGMGWNGEDHPLILAGQKSWKSYQYQIILYP